MRKTRARRACHVENQKHGRTPRWRSRRRIQEGVSRDEVFDDFAVDVGEAEVAASVAVGEFLVVEAE